MKKVNLFLVVIIYLYCFCGCSSSDTLNKTEIDEKLQVVQLLGKKLYNYDAACWIATDSLFSINPDKSLLENFFAYENDGYWQVGFGKPDSNKTKFLVSYEVFYYPSAKQCKVNFYKEPKEDKGFYYKSNKALTKAMELFNPEYAPYNYAVLPLINDMYYVYIYPAQQSFDKYRFGGDIRYTYSAYEDKIIDSLRLHKRVLEMPYFVKENDSLKNIKATYHYPVTTKTPVETDLLYVFSRKFSAPHYVITKDWVFIISEKGEIISLTPEVFSKIGS